MVTMKFNQCTELFLCLINAFIIFKVAAEGDSESLGIQKFKIDGKVTVPFSNDQDWLSTTRILVDGGEFVGFLK